MGRNTKGGKKHKKFKNNNNQTFNKRELIFADTGQDYFIITKMLGDNRCRGNSNDGREALMIIRGRLSKKKWIRQGDVVLGSFRDFSSNPIADIIHKYSPEEVTVLKKMNKLTMTKPKDVETVEEYDIGFTFEDL